MGYIYIYIVELFYQDAGVLCVSENEGLTPKIWPDCWLDLGASKQVSENPMY